ACVAPVPSPLPVLCHLHIRRVLSPRRVGGKSHRTSPGHDRRLSGMRTAASVPLAFSPFPLSADTSSTASSSSGLPRRVNEPRNSDSTRVRDRKSTRLNSSHVKISYAVFCLKKKK